MNRKNRTTEDFCWEQDTYRTGSTQPPKSYGGVIAFLLGLVIFLCGISTALGLMNIRLFRALNDQAGETGNPVVFSRSCQETDVPQAEADYFPLGFTGHAVTDFWNQYDALPQGIYITDVCGNAADAGIAPGDILLWVSDQRITEGAELTGLLSELRSGDSVDAVIYRDGRQHTFRLTLE